MPFSDDPPPTPIPQSRDDAGDDDVAGDREEDRQQDRERDREPDVDDQADLPDPDDIEDIDDLDETAGAPDDFDISDAETEFSVDVAPGEQPPVYLEKGSPRLERGETGEPTAVVYGLAIINETEPDGEPVEFALTFDEPVASVEVSSAQWDCRADGESKLFCRSTDSELALDSVSLLELTVGLAPPPELDVSGDGPSSTDLAVLLVATVALGLVVYWFVSGRRDEEEVA